MKPLFAIVLLLAPALAGAHSGTSYSEWTIDGDRASVRARVSQLELTRLQLDPASTPDYADQVGARLREDLQLWSESGRCEPGPALASPTTDGWVAAQWSLRCPHSAVSHDTTEGARGGAFLIRTNLFLAVAPSHLHFARVEIAGAATSERVLTSAEPAFRVDAAPDLGGSFARYVRLGIEHILSGWDHLAFVLALILLAASVREVALLATGFTLAHSLTLGAAVLGWVKPQAAAVEALIGFSIAIIAAENLWQRAGRERWVPWVFVAALLLIATFGAHGAPYVGVALFTACYFALVQRVSRPMQLRIAVAFLFGLVHGFGFAGALTSLHLPQERLAIGLLGFNSGVELGQLGVIALVWPALKLLSRAPAARLWAGDLASTAICALGVFWFVTRALGGVT